LIGDEIERLVAPLAGDVGPALEASLPAGSPAELFPVEHIEVLRRCNGFTVFHGAFRLFGVRPETSLDLGQWNAAETWKFAWDDRVDPYVLIGETVWGDQYAYRRGPSGGLDGKVYFLEGTLLRPEAIASSFEDFFRSEFLRNATQPYDQLTVDAVRRLGPIRAGKHWAYVPSIALGGPDSIENVVELPAVTAMTFAGDLASALEASSPDSSVTRVTPWTDERGRARLRVSFS
jgi:hypothetical protein